MGIETAIIGGSLLTGVMGMSAAESAGDAQIEAAQRGADVQERNYLRSRADLAPYRESGYRGLDRLNYLLGLSPGGSAPTREQFTTTTPATRGTYVQPMAGVTGTWTGGTPGGTRFDEAGYNQALQEYNQMKAASATDPAYGSLMKPFTGANLETEPGYQFTLQQGQNALQQNAIARGNFLSGNTLKELARYSTDYAGTKYNDAFSRDAATKNQMYNFLTGITNQGMSATASTVGAGTNAANVQADLATQQGNAAAASQIGQANALSGAFNQGLNAYLLSNYLSSGAPRTSTGNISRNNSW